MDNQFTIKGVTGSPEDPDKKNPLMVEVNPEDGLCAAMEKIERLMIEKALRRNEFNKTWAARELKMTRHSLFYRMKKRGIPIKKTGISREIFIVGLE